MNTTEFKNLCKKEFGVKKFSVPNSYAKMSKTFDISARTYQNWIAKKNIRPWFDKMVGMYFEIKKLEIDNESLKSKNKKLEQTLIDFNERFNKIVNR